MKLLTTKIFKIRILYKSGYTHDFECTHFEVTNDGKYTWKAYDQHNRPVVLGVDDIAAVWQLGYRTKFSLFLKFDK